MIRMMAILLGCMLVLSGCGGGGGGETQSPSSSNFNGYWGFTVSDGHSEVGKFTQNGSSLTIDFIGGEGVFTGSINSNEFTATNQGMSISGTLTNGGTQLSGVVAEGATSASYTATILSPGLPPTLKTLTLSAYESFDFSTGEKNPANSSLIDLTYDTWGGANGASLDSWGIGGGVLNDGIGGWLNWVNNVTDLEEVARFSSFFQALSLQPSAWHGSESIWDTSTADPTGIRPYFDARDRWACLIATREGDYALAYVTSADQTSVTLKYVYPYDSTINSQGYWDVLIPSMQAGKLDADYLIQSGANITGKTLQALGEPSFSGTISGSNVILDNWKSPECTQVSGTLFGQTITGTCTQGTETGLAVNFAKSTFYMTNFAPGDTLSTTPTFVWTAKSGADSYSVSIMRDNASGTCSGSCVEIWRADPLTATSVTYNNDSSASENLLPGTIYRARVRAYSGATEIDTTMDIHFQVN